MKKMHESFLEIDDIEDEDFDVDRGFIMVSEGMAWGPFLLPEDALKFAMKYQPDMLFKLHVLMNPAILE